MKLRWTKRALSQLRDAEDYIAQENPEVAKVVAERIASATCLLLTQPQMGRPGRIANTREWVVSKTPYFIAYSVLNEDLIILRVIHEKQHWPQKIKGVGDN